MSDRDGEKRQPTLATQTLYIQSANNSRKGKIVVQGFQDPQTETYQLQWSPYGLSQAPREFGNGLVIGGRGAQPATC